MCNRRTNSDRFGRGSERGSALVEIAIGTLLFLVIIFGIMEFGRMIWQYNVVAFAAKEGARWAAVRGATSSTPATDTTVHDYVISKALGEDVAVSTTWNPTSKNAGSLVTVQVSETFTPMTNLVPSVSITLRSTSQMIIVR